MKSIRILSIGNSFSEDAHEFLHPILEVCGFTNIILGNLYIGGASLEVHSNSYENTSKNYIYFKQVRGHKMVQKDTTLIQGLVDEPWDYITMQQASGWSGIESSYEPYLSKLISLVQKHKTNPDVQLLWHMTWAYQADSTHSDFSRYDNLQQKMIEAIKLSVKKLIVPRTDFVAIIPTGTTIQNLRQGPLGDTLTRDGFHLSLDRGRWAAAMTWGRTICKTVFELEQFEFLPLPQIEVDLIVQAVNDALKNPF